MQGVQKPEQEKGKAEALVHVCFQWEKNIDSSNSSISPFDEERDTAKHRGC